MAQQTCTMIGKVAIITGSSSGIGLATAVKLASLGCKVTITGRNLEGLADAKKKCIAAGLKEADVLNVAGEISDENTREKLVSETMKKFGKIDILVNNAGTMPPSGIAMGNATMETFDKVFDVNVRSLVDLTMKTIPHLIQTKGNVVNISSIGGMRPVAPFLYYCMTKSSVEMFTRGLAQELGAKGVRANTISPGLIRTNLPTSAGMPKEALDKGIFENEGYKNLQALERIGEPEEIADLVAFLASDHAAYITGANIVCDGGATVKGHGVHTSAAAAMKK